MQFRLAKNASGAQDAFRLFVFQKPILLRLTVAEEPEHLMKLKMGSHTISQSDSEGCYCNTLPSDCLFDCVIIPQFRFHFFGSCNFHEGCIFEECRKTFFYFVRFAAT